MLISSREMLRQALEDKYAVGQFNINNLEWIKAVLKAASAMSSPVILGVTPAACVYMGGPACVAGMVFGMARNFPARLPIALHLDHSGAELCLEAVGAGFTSIMFDGSHLTFAENLEITAKLARVCEKRGLSLEAELGSPAGEEDGISGSGAKASLEECKKLAESGVDILAASIGNIHGQYPPAWPGLDFALLKKIHEALPKLPLALHGGSGIPPEMTAKAIQLGVAKINVNTECQIAFANALEEYFTSGKARESKGYSLQKITRPGMEAIKKTVMEKIEFFGSQGKAAL